MVISYNSQLGLRFNEVQTQYEFLMLMKETHEWFAEQNKFIVEQLENAEKDESGYIKLTVDERVWDNDLDVEANIERHKLDKDIRQKVTLTIGDKVIIDGEGSSYYFICDSVYKAAELIKIGENFTGRTLKDINFGKYTYLMGKHRMTRFIVDRGVIKGIYYDDKERRAFEWGIELEDGGYYYDFDFDKEFSMIMRVLTFVELGDIEVKMLEAGRNNGGKKNVDKVTNTSNATVYVVDSSWNQIIMRTTGFAVRGHFRLQPCGENHKDRKLIWIDAFEKHGYKRKPTGEIVRHTNA